MPTRLLVLAGSPIAREADERAPELALPIDFRPRNFLDLRLKRVLDREIGAGVRAVVLHQTTLLGSVAPWLVFYPFVALLAFKHILTGASKRDPWHALLYRRVDALVAMSGRVRANILATHPIAPERVPVISLGLDFSRFDPARVNPVRRRAEWGLEVGQVAVGLVGRLDPAKGQTTLIAAAQLCPPELRIVLVGQETEGLEGRYLAQLQAQIASAGLTDRFIFAGYQDDVPEVMAALDIVVMPSRDEAFGLVAIEAMAMGRAVVIAEGPSAREILGEAGGLTVPPDDPSALAAALQKLAQDPSLCLELGAKGQAHVRAQYDRRVRALHLRALIDESVHVRV